MTSKFGSSLADPTYTHLFSLTVLSPIEQVGSATAYLQTGMFSTRRYFVLLISSVLIITWLNLSNDVYDFDTGADKNKTESVVNLVGRDPCYCLLASCPWLHWADMGICGGRKSARNYVTDLCSYLWLHISVPSI